MADNRRASGGVICAAGDGLAPADKKPRRFAMSRERSRRSADRLEIEQEDAEGADGLVLDVKTATTFMSDLASRKLACTWSRSARRGGARGHRSPPWMFLWAWPSVTPSQSLSRWRYWRVAASDLIELVIALANEMLDIAGINADPREAITSGRAMDHWRRMVSAQGGDPDAPLPVARHQHVITAPVAGSLSTLEAYGVGVAAWRLGAGRAHKEDEIIHGAGVRLHAKPETCCPKVSRS